MKEEFLEWAHGKIVLVHSPEGYANHTAQVAWEAWQRAWSIAVQAQRKRDEEEIEMLRSKVSRAMNILGSRR